VTRVKVCGITSLEDARLAIGCGADELGLNLIAASPRALEPEAARRIAQAVAGQVAVVGVVADVPPSELLTLRQTIGLDLLQLHGSEPPEWLEALLPGAYKALRIAGPEDVAQATRYRGDRLLVDAKVVGRLGGTGTTFDWSLVRGLASERQLMLAGGLRPDNVARAVAEVRPWAVDVASGVEPAGEPRRKDPSLLKRFMEQVRAAG